MRKIGLIGGISWTSTIEYYKYINEGINQKLGNLNFAECIIYSLNFGDVQEKGWVNSFPLLLNACETLKKSGAEAIVLCANTAHLFADDLQDKIGLPVISIITATVNAVHNKRIKKIGLLGTKVIMEMEFYKHEFIKGGIEVLIPDQQTTRDYIQETLKNELGKGIIKPETKTAYIAIANELIANGAEGIILGCTEIPLIINTTDISVPVFDTTKIHSAAAVEFALSI
ncbi:MAG: amino acid racemase [Mucilaginibacter sp.]|jgi:aspartate racemase|uniref:aspartate/glutamate racemase family protein n=1 Tax=Mucilaginibacter sp. TaxID=1882438 RepID=UPI003564DEAC